MEYTEEDRAYSVLVNYEDDSIVRFMKDNPDFIGYRVNSFRKCLDEFPQVEYNYVNDLSLLDILQLSKDFLGTIDRKYISKFEELINDGSFNIFDSEDEENLRTFPGEAFRSYTMDEDGKFHENINIPLSHTIEDVYTIVHEFIHITNYDPEIEKDDREFFTEASSITYEFLLYDYLKNNDICNEDNCFPIFERIDSTYKYTNGLIVFLNSLNKIKIDEVKEIADEKKVYEDYKGIVSDFKYSVGNYLSVINYANYKKGLTSLENIKSFNDNLNKNDDFESLRHVLLSVPDSETIKSSLEILRDELFSSKNRVK